MGKKKTGPLGPGALLVHSDFSLKLRTLALRSSNPPENLFALTTHIFRVNSGLLPSLATKNSDLLVFALLR